MGRMRLRGERMNSLVGLLLRRRCLVLGFLPVVLGCEQESECPTTTTTGFFVTLECERKVSTDDLEAVAVEFRRKDLDGWTKCESSRPGVSGIVCAPEGADDVIPFVCAEHGGPAGVSGPRFPGSFIVRAEVGERLPVEEEVRLEAHADGCMPDFKAVKVKVAPP